METLIALLYAPIFPPFEPTYKGWKLKLLPGGGLRGKGFKPTYKGWKFGNVDLAGEVIEGFKPTYKGWKLHDRSVLFSYKLPVLSLPTRDGNLRRGKMRWDEMTVLSLPTRNGNIEGPDGELNKGRVLSLPTRNGNLFSFL